MGTWNARELDPEWPFDLRAYHFAFDPARTALLVIDLQVCCTRIDPAGELGRRYPAIADYWNQRMDAVAIPATRRLIDHFHANHRRVIFTRMGSLTAVGDEAIDRLKPGCYPSPLRPGVPGFEVDPRLPSMQDDLMLDKLGGSAFTATCLDYALKNMRIRDLILTGCLTDQCVLGTARSAVDMGFNVLICEDACVTYTPRAHTEALLLHARRFGRVDSAEQVLQELNAGEG